MSRMGGGVGALGGYSYRTVRDIVFEGLSVQRVITAFLQEEAALCQQACALRSSNGCGAW